MILSNNLFTDLYSAHVMGAQFLPVWIKPMPSTCMPSVSCPTSSPARTMGHASQAPLLVRRFGMVYSLARKSWRTVLNQGGHLRFRNFFLLIIGFGTILVSQDSSWWWRTQHIICSQWSQAAQKVMICPGTQHQPWKSSPSWPGSVVNMRH